MDKVYTEAVEKVLSFAEETMDVNKMLNLIEELRNEQLDVDFANEAMLKALHMMCEEQGNKEDAQELSGILEELGIQ